MRGGATTAEKFLNPVVEKSLMSDLPESAPEPPLPIHSLRGVTAVESSAGRLYRVSYKMSGFSRTHKKRFIKFYI